MNEDFNNGPSKPRTKIKLPTQQEEQTDLGAVSFEDSQTESGADQPEPQAPTSFDPPERETKPRPHRRLKNWFQGKNTWQQIVIMVILLGILAGVLWAAWGVFHRSGTITVTGRHSKKQPPAPTTVQSNLTGLQVDPEVNGKQVTGVMIENSTFARPQSGLDSAGIVFEALAEGGITRFMALYQDTEAPYLGPVRSARPYYIQWCMGFDCAYAHVGGSPEALSDINAWNVKDLNQFSGEAYFHRISSRSAPHNMYTSTTKLAEFEAKKGYNGSSYTGFAHLKTEPKVDPKKITVETININYPGTAYDVSYTYDRATNSYKRFLAGKPHNVQNEAGAQTQLSPKVVIAMTVPLQAGQLDSSNAYYSDYQTIGSGEVRVFQNGQVITGTWRKDSGDAPIILTDSAGKPIQLTPGQAWISVIASSGDATYQVIEPAPAANQPKQ